MRWMGRYEGYNASAFRRDLVSGLLVGIIAIPLGMAFAIASGVKPEYGIYTTVVAGFLISLFGGSRFQIGGPTGAFIPILFAIVMQYGYENLLIAGFMAGIMLVLMGVFKLGALIKFFPRPVIVGFTAGIAVIIFSGQISNFLGLHHIERHEYFLLNMAEIAAHLSDTNLYSVITALLCLAIIIFLGRKVPKFPGSLIAIIISGVFAALFLNGKVETIGSAYGAIPNTFPAFKFPEMTWSKIEMLLAPAFVIAMLGSIESLLSAVVADGMTGNRHNSNRELIGQGIANIVTPMFGGIPATGAIARTATNIKTGAFSPISGMIHALVVLLILYLFAPYASHIPLASIAPILMIVAWNMCGYKEFLHVLRTKSADSVVLVITFLLTVLLDLTIAVGFGLVLAIILFVKRMSEVLRITKVLPDPKVDKVKDYVVKSGRDCPQISIFTIEGPLFFGAANMFEKTIMDSLHIRPKVLLLRMGQVPFMDTTGEANLTSLVNHFKKQGGKIIITGIQEQPLELLKTSGLYERIGAENIFPHTGEAITTAIEHIDHAKCIGCKHFAFRECTKLSAPTETETAGTALSHE